MAEKKERKSPLEPCPSRVCLKIDHGGGAAGGIRTPAPHAAVGSLGGPTAGSPATLGPCPPLGLGGNSGVALLGSGDGGRKPAGRSVRAGETRGWRGEAQAQDRTSTQDRGPDRHGATASASQDPEAEGRQDNIAVRRSTIPTSPHPRQRRLTLPPLSARPHKLTHDPPCKDYDCFYASVLENRDPSLKSLPVGVRQKGILATCNYAARARGVAKLSQVSAARRACPDLVVVDGEDLTPFRDVSKRLYGVLRGYSWGGRVERLGLDEVFMGMF